jgi:hypothetical protein
MSKNYKGSGAKSDNAVAKEVSKISWSKTLNTIEINDKYRAYQKTVPEGVREMTFLEFKESLKPVRKKSRKPKTSSEKNSKPKKKVMSKNEQKKRLKDPKRLSRLEKFKSTQKAPENKILEKRV